MNSEGRGGAREPAAAETATEEVEAPGNEGARDGENVGNVGGVEDVEAQAGDAEEGEMLLELVLAEHAARGAPEPPPDARIEGVVIGRLVGFAASGDPLVNFAGSPQGQGLAARAAAALREGDLGRRVALMFEGGSPSKPIVLGLIHEPAITPAHAEAPAPANATVAPDSPAPIMIAEGTEARVDGERVVFTAEKEIVLQCGKASITLTRAGKILIRGAYLLARSTGVNRIQGGSVQIN
jgi:hypothetical protein